MDHLEIILWAMSGGFAIMFALMLAMWNGLSAKGDRLENKMDKLDEKLTDIDRRLCRLEGAFTAKDCCVLNESHRHHKQAEGQ